MNRIGDSLFGTGANQEVVEAFTHGGVEFIVIGGLAVAWHCASRTADDMDLLVNPTPENAERVSAALSTLHLSGFSKNSFTRPGFHDLGVDHSTVYRWLKRYVDLLTDYAEALQPLVGESGIATR